MTWRAELGWPYGWSERGRLVAERGKVEALLKDERDRHMQVPPAAYCPPRHPQRFRPSFLESTGIT